MLPPVAVPLPGHEIPLTARFLNDVVSFASGVPPSQAEASNDSTSTKKGFPQEIGQMDAAHFALENLTLAERDYNDHAETVFVIEIVLKFFSFFFFFFFCNGSLSRRDPTASNLPRWCMRLRAISTRPPNQSAASVWIVSFSLFYFCWKCE
jgi:hypothetical protein